MSGAESRTLEVTAYAKVGNGQEIYPSEELVMKDNKSKNNSKDKILYAVDGIAAMHSQKVGNALRTIDTWYQDYTDPENGVGPIAAEPYGAVTHIGKAFRQPIDKADFYTLFANFAGGKSLADNEKHYVMSVLIRGGVFGMGD